MYAVKCDEENDHRLWISKDYLGVLLERVSKTMKKPQSGKLLTCPGVTWHYSAGKRWHTSKPWAGFLPAIPVSDRPKTLRALTARPLWSALYKLCSCMREALTWTSFGARLLRLVFSCFSSASTEKYWYSGVKIRRCSFLAYVLQYVINKSFYHSTWHNLRSCKSVVQ
jgi:hypothetical protein